VPGPSCEIAHPKAQQPQNPGTMPPELLTQNICALFDSRKEGKACNCLYGLVNAIGRLNPVQEPIPASPGKYSREQSDFTGKAEKAK
jgi:hypothetical protein